MKKDCVTFLAVFIVMLLAGCGGGGDGGGGTAPLSSEKAITAFSFVSPAATGIIDENAKTITMTVPNGTNVTALVATFTTTGKSVQVGATVQVCSNTPNDFTNPVAYVVTAEDGSTATYTVTVILAPSSAKAITSFLLTSPTATGIIDENAKTIFVTVPNGTNVTALVATFTTTGVSVKVGAIPQVSGITPNDFTNPVAYVVTAEDGTTATYTVTVTIAGGAGSYTIGGTVSGLTGTLVVQNNSADDLTIISNGTFTFVTELTSGSTYTVSVKTNPVGQRCTVMNGSGKLTNTDISNVSITCITHNIVFVTSTSQTGNLGGLAGADAVCAARATAAGLPGTYVAWLSTSGTPTIHAKDRLGGARGWIRPDGRPFTDTVADLTSGKIYYPPRLDEFGNDVGKDVIVLTATTSDGLLYLYDEPTFNVATCQNWSSASTEDFTEVGYADGTTYIWTGFASTGCSASARLYCFGLDQSNALAPLTDTGRYAFTSSGSFLPGSGIAAADSLCQSEATAAGLPGTYKALLAVEGASASSRFSFAGAPWVRPDGVAIVEKASDLATDLLMAPIGVSAGGLYLGNLGVWVGASSLSDAGSESTCASWTSNSAGLTGLGTRSSRSDVAMDTNTCDATWIRIWCLQE